ncbi:MAG: hypothetical protein NUV75_05790 [Gallionella sp.]|nr:hypothetical protein [Gallionella sp.]
MIILPWPPASLSGHNKNRWWVLAKVVKAQRDGAHIATLAAKLPPMPDSGDIRIHFRFVPPDRRGDRVSFPNRLKAAIDGIADALEINDARFLPSYEFCEPQAPGRVEVEILGRESDVSFDPGPHGN